MSELTSTDPRTGRTADQRVPETTPVELDAVLAAAAGAAAPLAARSAAERRELLCAVADALDAEADELVALADRETGLGAGRLRGELARTTGQLRFLGDVAVDGGHLGISIDTADPAGPATPVPDLRRTAVPLGPVLVFAASNFPFAFSVAGGDTAAALATGCPVVLKAHPAHPLLSVRTAQLVASALAAAGAPPGAFGCVHGFDAGPAALADPRIQAAAFTGSYAGGTALAKIAASRPDPIPFYGELGSINPVVITPGALTDRAEEIAQGLLGSFTLGTGQFCTKPGIVLVPAGSGFPERLAGLVDGAPAGPMLTAGLRTGFRDALRGVADHDGVATLAEGGDEPADGVWQRPALLHTDGDVVLADPAALSVECFGPATLLVSYAGDAQLRSLLAVLPGALTATLHAAADEPGVGDLVAALGGIAGRVIWGGWPTGVAVSWAQQHGGPTPATTQPQHTSVGAAALVRFVRPVAYQDTPDPLLPAELRNRNTLGLLRRVNGRPTTADVDPGEGGRP